MHKFQIRHKRPECIGCGVCAEVAPHIWSMDEDGLAKLQDVSRVWGEFDFGEVYEESNAELMEAQNTCPVNIINITPIK